MNIVIFWEQYSWGGTDSQLLTMIKNWPEENDQFTIISNRSNLGLKRIHNQLAFLDKDIKFIRYNSFFSNIFSNRYLHYGMKVFGYIFRPIIFLLSIVQHIFILKKLSNIDVFIANNGGYPASWGCLASIISAKILNLKVISLIVHHYATSPGPFFYTFESIVDTIIARSLDVLFCVSQATKNSIYNKRSLANYEDLFIKVIYNGVELNEMNFSKSSTSFNIRKKFSIKSENYLFGILGRVELYKGHYDVIEAISLLDERIKKNIHLVIIGSGNDECIRYLKRQAKYYNLSDNIHFTGFLDDSNLSLISQLDLLICATRSFEGFGLTIAEAISTGTPVLATNVGAISEYLTNQMASIVSPCEPSQIMEQICDYINNQKFWIDRASSSKFLFQKYSARNMSRSYRKILVDMLNLSI